jgi:hypothetical protein
MTSPISRIAAAFLVAASLTACTTSTPAVATISRTAPTATQPPHTTSPVAAIRPAARHPHIPAVDLPNHALTPGVAFGVGTARICVPGYGASVRNVPDSEKAAVYRRYGIVWVPYQHEVDHLISLEIGGSNAIRNLWPEPYAGRWGARTKDVLENRLHDLVCSGRLTLRSAQRQEANDWVAAYRRYVGTAPGGGAPGPSPGGFYASSYPSASTIYCADDREWRNLSPHYLVHFATFAQAKARFPGYHLHRPC